MNVKAKRQPNESRECRLYREAILARFVRGRLDELAGVRTDPESHLRHCPACRKYEAELRLTVSVLRDLASAAVEPSAAFEPRWRRAVLQTSSERRFAASGMLQWLQRLIGADWKPASALACLWLVIAGLSLTTPVTGDPRPTQSSAAASPVDTFRWLTAEGRLLASLW